MTSRRSIRWHLLQVQLVSIVPIGIFAAALLYFHWETQDAQRQRSQIESVRLLAAAVDNGLDSTVERLSIFARLWSSSALTEGDVYAQARGALQANSDWDNILAFDASGRGVFRADAPFGSPIPPSFAFAVWRPVFERREPVISDVLTTPGGRAFAVGVGVPVIENGTVTYVLVASLKLKWYDRLLNKQGQPEGAVAALVDRHFKFVARSHEGPQRRGSNPTAAWVADAREQPEGLNSYVNLNGTPVYTAWTATRYGWVVGFGTPSAPVDSALADYLMVFGLLWVGAVAVGMLYAVTKAAPIAASLESLERQARHVAVGQRITGLPDSRVEEVHRAVAALERASELLQSTTRQRDESLETERDARAAAEAANEAKDEFLAMLGHELRNPLAAIANATAIARSERRSADQLEFAIGVIERQSRHLKHMIDDLLDVGRAVTGKISLKRAPLNVAVSAHLVVEALGTDGRLDDREVALDLQPAWIDGDQTRIEQIVTNLLTNAVRHTTSGGRIKLTTGREGGDAVIHVTDDGAGIAGEHLARVFDLFYQAGATPDRAGGGLGIGLTLVQRIARLHGGDVGVASPGQDHGATFTVRLPATGAPAARPKRVPALVTAGQHKVLVVEDNADTRESLCIALELQGYCVLRANNGLAALELIHRELPDVALLDIGLPGMDGYQLARRVRAEVGEGVGLVAVTGYGSRRDAEEASRAGFDCHLTKPVDLDELADAVKASVAANRAQTSPS